MPFLARHPKCLGFLSFMHPHERVLLETRSGIKLFIDVIDGLTGDQTLKNSWIATLSRGCIKKVYPSALISNCCRYRRGCCRTGNCFRSCIFTSETLFSGINRQKKSYEMSSFKRCEATPFEVYLRLKPEGIPVFFTLGSIIAI